MCSAGSIDLYLRVATLAQRDRSPPLRRGRGTVNALHSATICRHRRHKRGSTHTAQKGAKPAHPVAFTVLTVFRTRSPPPLELEPVRVTVEPSRRATGHPANKVTDAQRKYSCELNDAEEGPLQAILARPARADQGTPASPVGVGCTTDASSGQVDARKIGVLREAR